MNSNWHLRRVFCASVAAVLLAAAPKVSAIDINMDFSESEIRGWWVGSAYPDWSGGVGDSPCMKLTDGNVWENGWFFLWDQDYEPTTGFHAQFKMMIGGGDAPADGLSFNYAWDYSWNPPFGEEGDGTGLSVCFDTYDNGGGEAPAIDIKKGGKIIWTQPAEVSLFRTGGFVPVEINVDQEGTLDLIVNNTPIVTGLKRAFKRDWGYFSFGGRAGGLTDKHFIDDIQITTTTTLPVTPYLLDAFPNGNAAKLDSNIQALIQDGQNQLDSASVHMKVDGVEVPFTLEKVDGVTTITYAPPGYLDYAHKYRVEVSFSDVSATPTPETEVFEFTTVLLRGPNGNFYELGYQPYEFYTWPQARAIAEQRMWGGVHGHLATITDRAEDEFIELIRSAGIPKSDPGVLQEAWVGGYQPIGSANPRDGWYWITGEGPISGVNNSTTYANWEPGEPNDGYGTDSENFLTVGLWGQFGWNDSGNFNSAMLRGYIVEYEAIAMPTDFKPGDPNNRVQSSSKGKINIAILTTPSFDASGVVLSKLSAGRSGVEARPVAATLTDIDGDGDLDLQLQFNFQDLGLRCGDTKIVVFAENIDGAPLRGTDRVELLNCPPCNLSITALQDAAHNTDVYLTVNSMLANATPPTVADEIVLKSFNLSGKLTWTKTARNTALSVVSPTTSVGTLRYSDLTHLQPLNGRVQVRPNNSGSPDVLQAEGKVLLRPDLKVTALQAPSSARVRQVVNVSAAISEANLDVGATCTAYLMSGDTVLDKAEGVAIGAGGQRVVLFATRFSVPGEYHLRVVASDVNPGDFDVSNNSSEIVLNVSETPLTAAHFDMSYGYGSSDYYTEERTEYGINVYRQKSAGEQLTENLYIPSALQFPVDRISASVYVDGVEKRFGELLNVATDTWEDGCFRYTWTNKQFGNNSGMYMQTTEDLCNGTAETLINYTVWVGGESFSYSGQFTDTWDIVDMYGWGAGAPISYNYLLPQNTIGAYFIFDSPGLKFGGGAEISNITRDSYHDEWDYPGENGTYAKGYIDQQSIFGVADGETHP